MSGNGEERRCAGLTLECGSFSMFVESVTAELAEARASGQDVVGYSAETLRAWGTLMQSPEDPDLLSEFHTSIFKNDFRPEDSCINIAVADVELEGLSKSFPAGFPDCTRLADRIGRAAVFILPD